MPKKAVRPTKRAKRRPVKKSWWENFLTFPKLALIFFILLSIFTIYKVLQPTTEVMGESVSGSAYK